MAMTSVNRIRLLPDTANPSEAASVLRKAGDASLVVRSVVRSLVLRCPCGCGDNYIINLDPRAGPAWRHYRRKGTLSLYPSYWRDGGCGSHFIINRNEIWWCRYNEEWVTDVDSTLIERVIAIAPIDVPFVPRDLADQLDEIPWEVHSACEKLTRQKLLVRTGRGLDIRYIKRST